MSIHFHIGKIPSGQLGFLTLILDSSERVRFCARSSFRTARNRRCLIKAHLDANSYCLASPVDVYPVGIVTMGAAPFSPVSTRLKTIIKKEKRALDIRSRSS